MLTVTFDRLAERNRDIVLLLARLGLAAIFLMSGPHKIFGFAGFESMLAAKGLPFPFLFALAGAAVEALGSLAIILGLFTRPVALLMAIFTLFAAFLGHAFWMADPASAEMQTIQFMKNIAITGGYLALFVSGAGAISLDQRLRSR